MDPTTDPDTSTRSVRLRRTWRSALAAALALGLLATGISLWSHAVGGPSETKVTHDRFARPASSIESELTVGDLRLAAGDPGHVQVDGTLTWSGPEPGLERSWRSDGTLYLAADCPNTFPFWSGQECSADVAVSAPLETGADLRTSTGRIDVRDLHGDLRLRSTTGPIAISGVSGPITAVTTTGDVGGAELRSTRVDATSSTGAIELGFTTAPELVTAHTTTGPVVVELPLGESYDIEVETTTGEPHLEVADIPGADRVVQIHTTTGDVWVRHASPEAAVDAASELWQDVRQIQRTGVTGVVAEATTPRGRLVARAGVADLHGRRPVPYGAHFRNGSDTKPYVATVVLQLVGEGRLRLDDPLEHWLPGLVRGNGYDGSEITVRDLLQHTSGIFDYFGVLPIGTADLFRQHRYDHYTARELVAMALRHEPEFSPGDTNDDGSPRWSYSNTGYALLGMIVEEITGRPWAREVTDRVLRPLGLRDTIVPGHSRALPPGYLSGYQAYGRRLVDATAIDPSVAGAAGSMVSTTADQNRFFTALIDGQLLEPRLLAQMQQTVPTHWGGTYEGSRYGLGLFWYPLSCDDAGYWGHGGDTLGYKTRGGVTADGSRVVTVAMGTQQAGVRAERQAIEASKAVDHALC